MKCLALFVCGCLMGIHLQATLFFTPDMISSHLKGYSEREVELIYKDLDVARSVCFEGSYNTDLPFYLATAGGPGSCKTTILERFVSTHPDFQGGVYLDPDPRALKFMVHTYWARSLNALSIADSASYDETIKKAYEKWRGGSNFIVLSLFEEAMKSGRSVIYGTTSTGAHMADFFARLTNKQYKIVLLLCSAPDEVRESAIRYRNKEVRFYQSSPEDAVSKGLLFPQRMATYFAHADQLYFYWSDSLFSEERLGGIWSQGELTLCDKEAMQCFIDKYEADRATLQTQGITLPAFETLLPICPA